MHSIGPAKSSKLRKNRRSNRSRRHGPQADAGRLRTNRSAYGQLARSCRSRCEGSSTHDSQSIYFKSLENNGGGGGSRIRTPCRFYVSYRVFNAATNAPDARKAVSEYVWSTRQLRSRRGSRLYFLFYEKNGKRASPWLSPWGTCIHCRWMGRLLTALASCRHGQGDCFRQSWGRPRGSLVLRLGGSQRGSRWRDHPNNHDLARAQGAFDGNC
jgi:hypothetical protein